MALGNVEGRSKGESLESSWVQENIITRLTHLSLDPELVSRFDIPSYLVGLTLTSIHNNILIILPCHRPDAIPEQPREEIVPRLISPMFSFRITLEHLVEGVIGSHGFVCYFFEG